MPISIQQIDEMYRIQLDGAIAIPSAAKLKLFILQGLASGQKLCFDLQNATELDIAALQLLWAAERESAIAGLPATISGRVPDSILAATVNAGFQTFPMGPK
jgi:16S rRNA U1498 N3-methylase RsmE